MKKKIYEAHHQNTKKLWTSEEDSKLRELVSIYGTSQKWSLLAKMIPGRSADQLRKRWHYKLDVHQRKEERTLEEDEHLMRLHSKFGNQWVKISKDLKGRPGAKVKHRFYFLSKRFRERPMTELNPEFVVDGYTESLKMSDEENTASSSLFISMSSSTISKPTGIYILHPCSKYFTQCISQPGIIPPALIIPEVENVDATYPALICKRFALRVPFIPNYDNMSTGILS